MSPKFEKDFFDESFRRKVRDLLDEAEEEIAIINGEEVFYQHLDLRWALERVIERGGSVKIYYVHPPQAYINKNLSLGFEIYRGDREPDNHYLIVDGKHTVTFEVRAGRDVGKREVQVRRNDEKFAQEKIELFQTLASEGEKITEMDIEKDPLRKLVNNPLDFGYDTHSEKFEEEL